MKQKYESFSKRFERRKKLCMHWLNTLREHSPSYCALGLGNNYCPGCKCFEVGNKYIEIDSGCDNTIDEARYKKWVEQNAHKSVWLSGRWMSGGRPPIISSKEEEMFLRIKKDASI